MWVHRSNRLEELVDRLDEVVRRPSKRLLEPGTILIQSAGMERYLSRELARRSGVAAGLVFPYPRGYFRSLLDATLGEAPGSELFEREHLAWALFEELATEPDAQIAAHLSEDADGTRRWLLAARLSHLFDQYLTYRPRMVLEWERSETDQGVQARLWRRIVARFGDAVGQFAPHFAARCARFLKEVKLESVRAELPSRLCLVGGPGLPPLFLQLLLRLSEVTEVHVFSFTVCQEYFAESHPLDAFEEPVVVEGEVTTKGEVAAEPEPLVSGSHPLLVSMGRVGADYQVLLETIGGYQDGPTAFFVPQGASVLSRLQQSLVLQRLGPPTRGLERSSLPPCDASLTLDSCHSPLREVEVLHDRLLAWFAEDETLRPEDIVVLAPKIEEYSPWIESVFSSRGSGGASVPYRIADRSERRTNAVARALFLGLSLLRGRFRASEMLDLMQLDPVRERMGIDAEGLARVGEWMRRSGIRSAVDAEHRRELGLVETDLNTWVFGLRRLLLGFAMPDDGTLAHEGTVPFDDVVPGDAELLGSWVAFCERLFSLRRRLVRAGPTGLPVAEWPFFLNELLDGLVAPSAQGSGEPGSADLDAVRRTLMTWGERPAHVAEASSAAARAAAAGSVAAAEELADSGKLRMGLPAVQAALEVEFDELRASTDFLTGGVTFCALLPLRTIPFRRVCVLGLGQGQFPRPDVESPLDLMRRARRRGDRSLRADDRYLFLELLHSASEVLALSYVGRSIQNNTEQPASVLIGELDAVLARLQPPARLDARVHPLQPFSPRYFSEPGLISFDPASFAGAVALVAEERRREPFFTASLPPVVGPEGEARSLGEVVRFFKDPPRALLSRLGVHLERAGAVTRDREPVKVDSLERFTVGDELLRRMLHQEPIASEVELRRGDLPVLVGGEVLLQEVQAVAGDIRDVVRELLPSAAADELRLETRSFELRLPVGPRWVEVDVLAADEVLAGLLDELDGVVTLHCTVDGLLERTEFGVSERASKGEVGREDAAARSVAAGRVGAAARVRLQSSFGQDKFSRRVALTLEHLALCAAAGSGGRGGEPGGPVTSVLVTRGPKGSAPVVNSLRSVPREQAQRRLSAWLTWLLLGLRRPLPLFGAASEDFVRNLVPSRGKSPEQARAAALHQLRQALQADPACREIFRGRDPLLPWTRAEVVAGSAVAGSAVGVDPDDLAGWPFWRFAEWMQEQLTLDLEADHG